MRLSVLPMLSCYQAKMIIHAFDTNIEDNPKIVIPPSTSTSTLPDTEHCGDGDIPLIPRGSQAHAHAILRGGSYQTCKRCLVENGECDTWRKCPSTVFTQYESRGNVPTLSIELSI